MQTLRASSRLRLVAVFLSLFIGFGVVTAGAAQAADEINASEKLNADQLKRLAGLPPAERDGIRDRLNQELAESACAPQLLGPTMIGQDCDGMATRAFTSFLNTPEKSLDYKAEESQAQFCSALSQEGASPASVGLCAVSSTWKKFAPLAGVALRTAVAMQPGGQFVLGAVDTVAFVADAKNGLDKFANSTKEAAVTATNEVLMNILKTSEFEVDDSFREMWGIFSGIGIVLLVLMYFKLFKDLSDEKIDFDTVRQSLFWYGPLSLLLAVFGPALAHVGHGALMNLAASISPWTSNQIMDFATTISRFAAFESNGVFGPLAAVLSFGLLFLGAWALLGLFALQPMALYLLGVGLAILIGYMVHPDHRAKVAKTGSLWAGIALSKPLILLVMGALFTFISGRPAFQGEGTGDALINASSVFTAAAAMVVLAFSPALLFRFVPILPSSAAGLGANRRSIAGAAVVAGAGAAIGSMIRKRRTAQAQSGGAGRPGGSAGRGTTGPGFSAGPGGASAGVGVGTGSGGRRGAGGGRQETSGEGGAAPASGGEGAPDHRTIGELQRQDRAGTPSGKAANAARSGAAAMGRGTVAVTRGSAKIAAGGATAFLLAGREASRQAAMRGRQGVGSMAPDTEHISGR